MSLSVAPHNVSPIRRKAILREHVDRVDEAFRNCEGADPVSLANVEDNEDGAMKMLGWVLFAILLLFGGLIVGLLLRWFLLA